MKKESLKYLFLLLTLVISIIGFSQDKISVTPVSFNTPDTEYAPVYFNNGLVFTGTNRKNEGLTYVDEASGNQLSDLYYIPLLKDSNKSVTLFSKELKSSFHDGPITFSKDGKTAYFTRSQSINKKLKNSTKISNKLGIYKATFNGDVWGNIEPCSFNSEECNTGQPSLSSDGNRLYFVSDKEGGFGGKDIYYVDIIDSGFSAVTNLGNKINTLADEMFPFIDQNNKLYFSSERNTGIGGLDIYFSKLSNNQWNNPYLMDTTVNSSADDFAIVFNAQETEGYFSSNKLGSDDIYKLEIIYPEFTDCKELIHELLCYEFYEEATLNADSVAMIYEWDFGDGIKERALETYHCYEAPGAYLVELNIMDPMVGETFVNEATYELEIEEILQPKITAPDTISTQSNFTVQVNQGKWKDYQIDNYYIDYGDSTIIKNSTSPHQYLSSGFKELKVLIAGYNDSIKEIQTNCFYKTIFVTSDSTLLASQKKFLDELKYSGFNTEKVEEFEDGVYMLEILSTPTSVINDTSILKSFTNKITEIYDTNTNYFSYVIGKTVNPFDLIEDYRSAHADGFKNALVRSYDNGKMKIEDLGLAYNNESGEVNVVLNNIQFEYNGHLLNNDSKIELEKLIQYLIDNENIKIEIGAHTDASRNVEKSKKSFAARDLIYSKLAHDRISKAYNLKLSQKRAKSVVKYLSTKGIKSYRLKFKGYGESNPLEPNYNTDGSANLLNQAKNRRVSFKILAK